LIPIWIQTVVAISTKSIKKDESDKKLNETENINKRKSLDLKETDTITKKKIKV